MVRGMKGMTGRYLRFFENVHELAVNNHRNRGRNSYLSGHIIRRI